MNIDRVLKLTTNPEKGAGVAMTMGPDGRLRVAGSGSAKVVLTGDVVDGDGNRIGELNEIASEAAQTWERCLEGILEVGYFRPDPPVFARYVATNV